MWPNGSIWNFGGGGGGALPPWQQPTGGGSGDFPWWVGLGVGLGERLGVWDWASDWLGTGGSGGNGGGTGFGGGVPTGGGGTGIASNFVTPFINEPYQDPTSAERQSILSYYEGLEGGKQRFVDWLKNLGLVSSIATRMLTGSIFDWPGILQDLIILYYHNQPKANEIAPPIVADANQNASQLPAAPGVGSYLSTISQLRPATLPLVPREAYHVPKGYVLVTDPMTKQKAVVLKDIARAAGLYKPRAKAPIKASEWKAAKKAKSIERKLSRMLGDSCNYKVTKKR